MLPVRSGRLVNEGRFKADLLDRLSFQVLHLPPLRLRDGDIFLLADHFARRFAVELGLEWTPAFAPSAIAELERYDWPGNTRELWNTAPLCLLSIEALGGPNQPLLVFDTSNSEAY